MIPFWYEIADVYDDIYIWRMYGMYQWTQESIYDFRTEWKMETYYLMFSMCIDNDLSFEKCRVYLILTNQFAVHTESTWRSSTILIVLYIVILIYTFQFEYGTDNMINNLAKIYMVSKFNNGGFWTSGKILSAKALTINQ